MPPPSFPSVFPFDSCGHAAEIPRRSRGIPPPFIVDLRQFSKSPPPICGLLSPPRCGASPDPCSPWLVQRNDEENFAGASPCVCREDPRDAAIWSSPRKRQDHLRVHRDEPRVRVLSPCPNSPGIAGKLPRQSSGHRMAAFRRSSDGGESNVSLHRWI